MSNSEEPENAIYVDDKTISDDTLYRRVLNQPDPPVRQIVWDENQDCWRPSSIAFCNHRDGSAMSIGLDDTLKSEGLNPESLLIGHEDFSLAMFTAKVARNNAQGIIRNPLENDPAHGEVFGKKTSSVRNALVSGSSWYVKPNIPRRLSDLIVQKVLK